MAGRAWKGRIGWYAGGLAFVAALAGGAGCDASSPCANVGCARAPECPAACSSECGCCPCSGTRECRSGGIYECTGSCYQLVKTCNTADACLELKDGSAICAESSDDCAAVKRAYEEEVAGFSSSLSDRTVWPGMPTLRAGRYEIFHTRCENTTECEVQLGHCEDGLGGPCFYLAESGRRLDSYAALYRRLGCATPTSCDCPSADIDVSCQDDQVPASCVVR